MSEIIKLKKDDIKETNEKLADVLKENIGFKTTYFYLIKPLAPKMIEVTQEIPIQLKDKDGNVVKDENGFPKYNKTKKEKKSVQSKFREGIIISVPVNSTNLDLKVGDKVIYNTNASMSFDFMKDSILLEQYNIVALYE